jgi:hypothetical protein
MHKLRAVVPQENTEMKNILTLIVASAIVVSGSAFAQEKKPMMAKKMSKMGKMSKMSKAPMAKKMAKKGSMMKKGMMKKSAPMKKKGL